MSCPRDGKECNEYMCGNMINGICGGKKLNCTDCLLDLTDACKRGAGRATDDEICDAFFSRETYEVNKNESWQLGYQQGRADAIDEFVKYANTMPTVENESGEIRPMWLEEMAEHLKEQKK